MRDVARMVGVSQATVSYVLNGKLNARVSGPTRERVLEAASRLQYRPNAIARAMALGRSRTVGVYQPDVGEAPLTGMWGRLVTQGISEALHEHGYHILLYAFAPAVLLTPGDFADGRADGVVILAPHVDDDLPTRLASLGFPVAVVGARPDTSSGRLVWVDCDNVGGAQRAVERLVSLGHTDIAHLRGPVGVKNADDRLDGYCAALAAAGLPIRNEHVLDAGFGREEGYTAAKSALLRKPRPTALFCANDVCALGALDACAEAGLAVPGDIAVVGFDDTAVCTIARPTITTLRQPAYEMGRIAAAMLLAMGAGESVEPADRVLLPELIVRESCGSTLRPSDS